MDKKWDIFCLASGLVLVVLGFSIGFLVDLRVLGLAVSVALILIGGLVFSRGIHLLDNWLKGSFPETSLGKGWEYVSASASLLLLVLGLFGPLILWPLVNHDFLVVGISLPLILLSGFLFSLGKKALPEDWQMVPVWSILVLYGMTLAGIVLNTKTHPFIVAWGLIIAVFTVLFYSLIFRVTGASFRSPPQMGTVTMEGSYGSAWELCHRAIGLLPSPAILSEDEDKGTIYAETRRFFTRSGIVIFLTRVNDGTTLVTVTAMSPGRLWIPELNSALNRRHVDTLCHFLLEAGKAG